MSLKVIHPRKKGLNEYPKYFFRYFIHAIGKGFHGDFRWKQNNHLRGLTIATMREGTIKEAVETTKELEQIVESADMKFEPDMDPTKHCLGFIKAKQPLEWLNMYDVVVEAGPGRSKENVGVFVLADEGLAYPGTKRPYFEELFLDGKQFKGRMVVRQLETPKEWTKAGATGTLHHEIWMAKDDTPYILSLRARKKKEVVPPDGISWLSPEWEKKIPDELRWWTKKLTRKQKLNLLDRAFNFLCEKDELPHLPLKLAEALSKRGNFCYRNRWWIGPIVKRGVPNVQYEVLIDTGKGYLDRLNLDKNALENPDGVSGLRKVLKDETPDKTKNSEWLKWEGCIPPKGVKLTKGEVVRREDRFYVIKINDEEIEGKPGPPLDLKKGDDVWTDNRKYIYTTPNSVDNPTKILPIYIRVLDKGRMIWVEDTDLFSSFKFYGKHLKGYWIAKKEDPDTKMFTFKKSELPGGDAMNEFRFAYKLNDEQLLELAKKYSVDIELLREWRGEHPEAPDGILEIEKRDLEEFHTNFKDGIVGRELPLDLEHKPIPGHAIGWLTDMALKFKKDIWHLFAKLNITDDNVKKSLKEGSLKWISPTINLNWRNPEDGEYYNIIRSAALTNYPYIKNMEPAVVNFSELAVEGEEETKLTEQELKEKESTLLKKEEEIKNQKAELENEIVSLKAKETELQEKYPGPFYGLPKDQANDLAKKCKGGDQKSCDILVKYATGGIYGYPKANMGEVLEKIKERGESLMSEDKIKELTDRITKLEEQKTAAETALAATTSEVGKVTAELEEKKVEEKIKSLQDSGKITPAQAKNLKPILLSKVEKVVKLSDKDGNEHEVDIADAIVQMFGEGPDVVDLSQRGRVVKKRSEKAETVSSIVNMSQEDWEKVPVEDRQKLIKKLYKLQEGK